MTARGLETGKTAGSDVNDGGRVQLAPGVGAAIGGQSPGDMAVRTEPGQPTFPLRQSHTGSDTSSHRVELSTKQRPSRREVAHAAALSSAAEGPRDRDLTAGGDCCQRCLARMNRVIAYRPAFTVLSRLCHHRFVNGESSFEEGEVFVEYLPSQLSCMLLFHDRGKSNARISTASHCVLTLLLWCQLVLQVVLAAVCDQQGELYPYSIPCDILGRRSEPVLNLLLHPTNSPVRIRQSIKLVPPQSLQCQGIFFPRHNHEQKCGSVSAGKHRAAKT